MKEIILIEEKYKEMLENLEDSLEKDAILQEDLKDFVLNIQWDICGVKGFQEFNNGGYFYKFGEVLDNPDITLEIKDINTALKLLNGEIDNFNYLFYKRKAKFYFIEKWEPIRVGEENLKTKNLKLLLTMRYTKGVFYHPFTITRLPIFRDIVEKWYNPKITDGSYLPINESLGTYEDKVLPLKILEHFINKAENFLMFHYCGCRIYNQCQDHDHSIGCMYLGSDTLNVKEVFPKITPERAHFGTREEAMDRVKKAYDDGLITVIGRLKLESESMGVPDRGHFMTLCFCCPCCCINGKWRYGTTELSNLIKKVEGISVKVDEELCVGCEECLKVCVFDGMEMEDGIAKVHQDKCLGCGRCERVCPNGAITISLDDPKRIEELIRRIEASVDVS
ncbi:MAG: 4Fe-4S dicluster domain-containing protein [Candidatus Lokiarchaeota archaeon]|nr:4Fe-4S dicluster domain-containing protein [Candidatus Lokiarchaeota archaeon]